MSLGLVQELFSEVGDVKRCSINYDLSGRSKVCAEILPLVPIRALYWHPQHTKKKKNWQETALRVTA